MKKKPIVRHVPQMISHGAHCCSLCDCNQIYNHHKKNQVERHIRKSHEHENWGVGAEEIPIMRYPLMQTHSNHKFLKTVQSELDDLSNKVNTLLDLRYVVEKFALKAGLSYDAIVRMIGGKRKGCGWSGPDCRVKSGRLGRTDGCGTSDVRRNGLCRWTCI